MIHQFARAISSIVSLFRDRAGSLAPTAVFVLPVVALSIGGSVDYMQASYERNHLQDVLDAGLISAAKRPTADRLDAVKNYLKSDWESRLIGPVTNTFDQSGYVLDVATLSDGSVKGTLTAPYSPAFFGAFGINTINLTVTATAVLVGAATDTTGAPCIYVLGSSGQDVLINSGATVKSTKCAMHVHSTANPAFIMNSGSTISLSKFCVKGTNYIKNGGTLSNMAVGCSVNADPYAGVFVEPTVPSICTTSGYFNSPAVSMAPGKHCDTGFNGTPTITFQPGLHIISGTMIINSGATVIADGVTFYFPDTNSKIQANGNLKIRATAPTAGAYKGVLMFEKTSNPNNNASKTQYVFNSSNGEELEGIIYLPNRNLTYNSTTTVTAKISMVVNQFIFNSMNWQIEPYTGGTSVTPGTTAGQSVKLIN